MGIEVQKQGNTHPVPHAAGVWHNNSSTPPACCTEKQNSLLCATRRRRVAQTLQYKLQSRAVKHESRKKKKKRRTEQRLGHRFSLQIHHFHHLLYSPITSIHLSSIKPRESIIFLKLQVQVSSLSSPPFSNSSQGKLGIHVQLLIS